MKTEALELPAVGQDAIVSKKANEAAARYNEQFYKRSSVIADQARNWMLATFVCLAIVGVLVFALWGQSKNNEPKLYIVGMDGARSQYLGMLKASDPTADRKMWTGIVVNQAQEFITAWRTVTTDSAAATTNYDKAFYFTVAGSQAYRIVAEWDEAKDENNRFLHNSIAEGQKGITNVVQFTSEDVTPESNTVWLWWTETRTDSTGVAPVVTHWKARMSFVVHLPERENARRANPFGIMMQELSVMPESHQ